MDKIALIDKESFKQKSKRKKISNIFKVFFKGKKSKQTKISNDEQNGYNQETSSYISDLENVSFENGYGIYGDNTEWGWNMNNLNQESSKSIALADRTQLSTLSDDAINCNVNTDVTEEDDNCINDLIDLTSPDDMIPWPDVTNVASGNVSSHTSATRSTQYNNQDFKSSKSSADKQVNVGTSPSNIHSSDVSNGTLFIIFLALLLACYSWKLTLLFCTIAYLCIKLVRHVQEIITQIAMAVIGPFIMAIFIIPITIFKAVHKLNPIKLPGTSNNNSSTTNIHKEPIFGAILKAIFFPVSTLRRTSGKHTSSANNTTTATSSTRNRSSSRSAFSSSTQARGRHSNSCASGLKSSAFVSNRSSGSKLYTSSKGKNPLMLRCKPGRGCCPC